MPFVKFSCIGKASVSVPATPADVDEFTAGEEGRPAIRKKGASINNVTNIRADKAAKAGKIWSLPRFLSVRAKLKKKHPALGHPFQKTLGRILDLAWLKFAEAALNIFPTF